MGLEEKLKKFYYTLEDAYYGVLDKINRHIPIYKVIDPIDKYIPSFMLFLLIIFLLVFWFVFLPILAPLIFPPVGKYYTASIKLVDSESAEPLKDVNITVKLVDYNQVLTEKTNEEGIASFEIPAEEVSALLSISHEGYEEIKEKQITLLADEVLTLELKRTGLYFAENKIEIYVYGKISGTVKQISDRTITITFQCQIGTPPTPINSHGSEQPFEVIRPKGCEGLSGTARAEGFKPQTKSLEGKTKVTFVLEEISSGEAKGDIEVTVYEYDYSYASDVIVRLYDAKTVSLITQKTTDASGTAVFKELKPGYYDIGVIADDGRTATKRNVEVNAGETTSVSITLPEPEVKAKKLFFKLLNEQNDEPVENARAFVYADDMFLDVFYSDAEGIVEYPIDTSIEDANFSALIAHPNFLPKRAYLNVLSIDATEPQVIKLRPKSTMISDYAPIAVIRADKYYGEAPLEVEFDASESFDPDGSIIEYLWDFGDGAKGSGVIVKHTFEESKEYEVKLTVVDDSGLIGETSVKIQVSLTQYAPVAIISADPWFGFAPLTVTFDASESTDPDGNIVSYEWNFGDGTTSTEKTVEHTYTQQGNYTVTLTVTDDDGLQDTESTEIRVLPPEGIDIPPIIILNVDYPIGQAPLSVTFDASNSYDPDSPEKELYYKWDFGDGTSTEGEGEATVMHIFEEPGNYNVELTVEDDEEQTSTQTVLIQVTEQPVSNFGKIVAFVVDSEGMPVEGAELWLYREDASYAIFPSPGEHIYTDSEGKYEFDYLEPSVYPYFVRASKEGLFAESDHIIVSAGETETLTVVLEKGYGEIKAIVVDEENNPITNAEVSLFDSITNELLNSCVTDLGGSCVLRPLEAGILVYLRACKEDYLCALSEDIQVIANNQHEVKLTLSKQPDPMPEKGVEISFKALCKDWECTEYATSVNSLEDSEKYYYAKFELTLFSDESQQVEAYFIAGAKDKEALLAEGYKIKILELRTAAASETWYATCFNPTDPYEILLECVTSPNSGAKLSKIIWDKVVAEGGVTIPITVKFAVEPGLNAGDMLELHYAARAMQAGEQIIAEEKTQSFEIGALICSGNSINWKFSLYKDDVPISEDISSEDTVELTLGEEYTLKFIAKNCTEEDYTGAKLEIWNENVPDAIEFPEFGPGSGPYTVYESIPYFAPNDSIEHSVKILAKHPAEFTYVKLKISKGSDIPSGGLASIKFRVLTGKEMLVEGLPDSLSPGIPITLEGYVKDADTLEGIENAVVTIYRNESILATLITESSATNKGYFYFAQDPSEEGPKAGDAIKLHITHPEYNDLIITIPVRAEPISEFACVTIEPSEPMSVTKGQSASFTITTNNCPDKLHVKLDSLLSLEKAEEVLEETDSKQIGFTASGDRVYQGIYPIYIKGKFVGSSSSQFRNIGVFDVLVTDPSSCFEMNTYVYNLKSGEASGTIKNKCIVPYADPQMPRLSIDKSAVELSTEPEPDGITFTWRIRSYAKEALSSGNVNEIALTSYEETREVTFNGSYTFVLGTFNAIDYIEGNDEKGITGLKEAPNYSGGYLYDVKFVPESSNERVVVWIEGNLIKGKYIGTKETEGIYDFTIKNKYLQSTEYAFVTIQDYVASGGGE